MHGTYSYDRNATSSCLLSCILLLPIQLSNHTPSQTPIMFWAAPPPVIGCRCPSSSWLLSHPRCMLLRQTLFCSLSLVSICHMAVVGGIATVRKNACRAFFVRVSCTPYLAFFAPGMQGLGDTKVPDGAKFWVTGTKPLQLVSPHTSFVPWGALAFRTATSGARLRTCLLTHLLALCAAGTRGPQDITGQDPEMRAKDGEGRSGGPGKARQLTLHNPHS